MIVLYEDAHCLAVAKPAGMLTQGPAAGETSLEAEVRRSLRPDDPGAVYLGTVHRLDRPVSGVVLWAKTPKAARRLADQFASRRVRKEYWAVVEGQPPAPAGLWDDWLCLDDTGLGVAQLCHPQTPRARRALTRYELAAAVRVPAGCSWLRLWPATGRTHQLRVQTAARGWPVVGDRAYGASRPFPAGIALHARSLTFAHPTLQRPITVEAALPESWLMAGIDLGRDPPVVSQSG
jgi:23S rRNA pseudouridine1911/1915/1917 synthase